MTYTPNTQPYRTLRHTVDDADTDAPSEAPPPIRNAQVLDSIHKLAVNLREGLAPLRELPDLMRDSAHKAACAAVKVVETRLDGHDARLAEGDKRLDTQSMLIAAQGVAVTEIKTTMKMVAAFIGFCFVAGGELVSITVWLMLTRVH